MRERHVHPSLSDTLKLVTCVCASDNSRHEELKDLAQSRLRAVANPEL